MSTTLYGDIIDYMATRDSKSISDLDGSTIKTSVMPYAVPSKIYYPDGTSGNITIN